MVEATIITCYRHRHHSSFTVPKNMQHCRNYMTLKPIKNSIQPTNQPRVMNKGTREKRHTKERGLNPQPMRTKLHQPRHSSERHATFSMWLMDRWMDGLKHFGFVFVSFFFLEMFKHKIIVTQSDKKKLCIRVCFSLFGEREWRLSHTFFTIPWNSSVFRYLHYYH